MEFNKSFGEMKNKYNKYNINLVKIQHLIKQGGKIIIKKGDKYYKVKELE